jgi:hypothetical protein
MRAPAIIALAIWVLVVGGNIIQTLTVPPETFMAFSAMPWFIVLLPIVVVVGAFSRQRHPINDRIGGWVDGRFGEGTYREFVRVLRLELLFAAMCLGIVLSVLVRAFIFKTQALPPQATGFFASGSVAFMAAYFIRRKRERADPRQ